MAGRAPLQLAFVLRSYTFESVKGKKIRDNHWRVKPENNAEVIRMVPAHGHNNPLQAFRSMLDEYLNEGSFKLTDRDFSGTIWPRVDVSEDDAAFYIRADLPGLAKEDIDVSVEGNVLSISGEKKEELPHEERKYFTHHERRYGTFLRSFTLPEHADPGDIEAHYSNGVLELRIKKTAHERSKHVDIS
ncbi:MAG: Hsp20/alpha crystallin family protein [Chitinivibrionales bacterium]